MATAWILERPSANGQNPSLPTIGEHPPWNIKRVRLTSEYPSAFVQVWNIQARSEYPSRKSQTKHRRLVRNFFGYSDPLRHSKTNLEIPRNTEIAHQTSFSRHFQMCSTPPSESTFHVCELAFLNHFERLFFSSQSPLDPSIACKVRSLKWH